MDVLWMLKLRVLDLHCLLSARLQWNGPHMCHEPEGPT